MDNKAMQLLQLLRVAADSSAQRVSQLNGGQKTGEWGPPRTAEFFEVLHAKLCGQFPKYFSFRTLIQIEKLKLWRVDSEYILLGNAWFSTNKGYITKPKELGDLCSVRANHA